MIRLEIAPDLQTAWHNQVSGLTATLSSSLGDHIRRLNIAFFREENGWGGIEYFVCKVNCEPLKGDVFHCQTINRQGEQALMDALKRTSRYLKRCLH